MNAVNDDELQEGCLYVYKKGVLQEIEVDPDDTMRKIRITDSAYQGVVEVQKIMRKKMDGFKPDVSTVCSALIKEAATLPNVAEIVQAFCLDMYQRLGEGDQND